MSTPFDWFDAAHTARIRDQLVAGGEGVILEVHPHPTNEQPRGIMVKVRPGPGVVVAEDGGGGTNNSHRCPPFNDCP